MEKEIDVFMNQFDEKPDPEICFQFIEEVEYRETISTFCLSHHGFIIGIGFSSGVFFSCDSRNFCNKHEYTVHEGEVTALSFSRDTLHIASGDRTGKIMIHNVVTRELKYNFLFPSPINSIVCSDYEPNIYLFLLSDCSLFILDLSVGEYKKLNNKFSSIIWGSNSLSFYGSYSKDVFSCQLDEDKTKVSISGQIDFPEKTKDIISMSISNDKTLLAFIDSRGNAPIYSIDFGTVLGTYKDPINHSKYSYSAFSNDKNYTFMVTKTTSPMTFAAYSNGDVFSITPVYSFKGLKEQVRGIIPHPIYPIIFVRFKYQIYTWTYYSTMPLYNSVPEKDLMRYNQDYCEHESEFDSSDDDDNIVKYEPLILKGKKSNDIISIFPDDVNFPNQIYFIPYQRKEVASNI
ncbi:hypothetical protein M9Y10_002753 [Tritrichomonas musculus]|uniref:Anaphase-promoting complex subunit 4 WD40 domain-containing protein n=1 Tax=Tritrichomonas musculus TaxID=1915356 RepID=A0ABR2LBP0_9EUKA